MKPYFIFIFLFASVLISFSCNENPTDSRPLIIRPPQEMIWTADTLKGFDQYAQLLPENLLVFASNDAWLVCWSDIARGLLWHFDGKTWNESNIAKDVGGMRVNDVAGYSSSDLWTCGYTGEEIFLAHYDGYKWTKYNTDGIKGELLDMCKDADGNLWTCGRNGLVMKFDRFKWIIDEVPLIMPSEATFFLQSIEYHNKQIYTLISTFNKKTLEEKYFYAKGTIKNWSIMDSLVVSSKTNIQWGYRKLFSNNEKLYSVGLFGIWSYDGDKWINIKNVNGAINNLYFNNNNYILAVGDFQKFLFFDGLVWTNHNPLFNINDPNFTYQNAWTNGYETFICGYGNFGKEEKLVVWRGK